MTDMFISFPSDRSPFEDFPDDDLEQAKWWVNRFETVLENPELIGSYGLKISDIEKMLANAQAYLDELISES